LGEVPGFGEVPPPPLRGVFVTGECGAGALGAGELAAGFAGTALAEGSVGGGGAFSAALVTRLGDELGNVARALDGIPEASALGTPKRSGRTSRVRPSPLANMTTIATTNTPQLDLGLGATGRFPSSDPDVVVFPAACVDMPPAKARAASRSSSACIRSTSGERLGRPLSRFSVDPLASAPSREGAMLCVGADRSTADAPRPVPKLAFPFTFP
jgi:hypothetical protein